MNEALHYLPVLTDQASIIGIIYIFMSQSNKIRRRLLVRAAVHLLGSSNGIYYCVFGPKQFANKSRIRKGSGPFELLEFRYISYR